MEIIDKIKHYSTKAVKFIKSKVPQSNPESLIAEAESKLERSRRVAEKQLLAIQELTASIKKDMQAKESELIGLKECIQIAASDRDEGLLVSLLMEEEESENSFMLQKKLYDGAVADALRISDNYHKFAADIGKLLKELATLKTRAQFLKMREQITLVENRFEQQVLAAEKPYSQELSHAAVNSGNVNRAVLPQADLIKQNSSRKRAQDRASALLQVHK